MGPRREGGLIHAQDNGRTPGAASGKAVGVAATGPAPHPLREPAREAASAPPPGWPRALPKAPQAPGPTTPSPPSRGLLQPALHPVFVACQCETVPCPSPTRSSKTEDSVCTTGNPGLACVETSAQALRNRAIPGDRGRKRSACSGHGARGRGFGHSLPPGHVLGCSGEEGPRVLNPSLRLSFPHALLSLFPRLGVCLQGAVSLPTLWPQGLWKMKASGSKMQKPVRAPPFP